MAPEFPPPFPPPLPTPPMALEAIDPRTFFTRAQLADTFEACGIPLSYDTLATKATRGGGPPFRLFGKNAVYQWADVVAWVRETMGEPARTTSEHRAPQGTPAARQSPSPEKIAAMVEGSRRYNADRVAARRKAAATPGPRTEQESGTSACE